MAGLSRDRQNGPSPEHVGGAACGAANPGACRAVQDDKEASLDGPTCRSVTDKLVPDCAPRLGSVISRRKPVLSRAAALCGLLVLLQHFGDRPARLDASRVEQDARGTDPLE